MIITGVDENKTTKQDVADKIKDKLGCDIKPGDIEYTLKLKHNNIVKGSIVRVRVVLKSIEMKDQIVKYKKKLRDLETR